MAQSWSLWAYECVREGHIQYRDVGDLWWVQIHNKSHPITPVLVVEDPDGPYWGWLCAGEDAPTKIWLERAAFQVCFPQGPEIEAERGRGIILRLRIEPRTFLRHQNLWVETR